MDRKTALSAAGALTMTSVAAVSALFLTVGRGADAASEVPAPPPSEVTYEVVQVPTDVALDGSAGSTIQEVEYVTAADAASSPYEPYEEHDEEHDEHDDDDEDDDD